MAAPANSNYVNYNRASLNPNSPYVAQNQAPMAPPTRTGALPWGSTFLNDLIIRPDFQSSVLEEFFERSQFVSSGIIQRNSAMDLSAGGVVCDIPFFKAFEAEEEEIDSDDSWGNSQEGYLSPQRINMSSFQVPVVHRGFAAAADDLSRLGSGEDPLAAIRSYVANNMAKFRQNYLLALLKGVFDPTSGALKDNALPSLGAATSVTPTDANFLQAGTVVGMQNILGERGDQLTTIAMHSAVRNQLVAQGMLTFSSPAAPTTSSDVRWGGGGVGVTNEAVEYFAGARIVVSDQLVTPKADALAGAGAATGDAMEYPVYFFGQGAVQEGVQSGLRIATERNILSLQDIIALDYHYLLGIPGISWKGAVGGKAPKNSDIATAGNWSLAWAHNEYVPITKVVVNSPFGGTYPA